MIFCDLWWNPSLEEQAVARAWRYGQTKEVQVYRLLARDTIETRVATMQAEKRGLIASVLPDGGFVAQRQLNSGRNISLHALQALFR